MAKQRESKLQLRIRKALRKEVGGWWIKIWGGPFTGAGTPDILGCVNKLFFAFEVKNPKEKGKRKGVASEIQLSTIEDIKEQGGGVALVVYSAAEAIHEVEKHLEAARWLSKRRR